MKALLARGADPDATDADGRSTLYVLALENRLDMARYLLERGADAEARDAEGRTPLHVSAWQVTISSFFYLLILFPPNLRNCLFLEFGNKVFAYFATPVALIFTTILRTRIEQ